MAKRFSKRKIKEYEEKCRLLHSKSVEVENLFHELLNDWLLMDIGKPLKECTFFNNPRIKINNAPVVEKPINRFFDRELDITFEMMGAPKNINKDLLDIIELHKTPCGQFFPWTDENLVYDYYSTDISEFFSIFWSTFIHYLETNDHGFNYFSEDFRRLRHEVFLRDGEVCVCCGATPGRETYLTIDHIKPVSKFPDLSMDIDNLQVLCWPCNKEKSNKHYTDYRKK